MELDKGEKEVKNKSWFDDHVIIDFGDSEKNKKVAENFKEKLKEKLIEETEDDND
tara:strand:+ start:242 stop:406 length:165 start_codon:yes stop_codon:yes gene_type:complete